MIRALRYYVYLGVSRLCIFFFFSVDKHILFFRTKSLAAYMSLFLMDSHFFIDKITPWDELIRQKNIQVD